MEEATPQEESTSTGTEVPRSFGKPDRQAVASALNFVIRRVLLRLCWASVLGLVVGSLVGVWASGVGGSFVHMFVAITSCVIAFGSIFPACLVGRSVAGASRGMSSSPASNSKSVTNHGRIALSVASMGQFSQGLVIIVASVMAIRAGGTVALFVLCRYQFGGDDNASTALVVTWYVYLTAVEVVAFARSSGLISLERSPS